MDSSRRDLIRKAAIGAGVVWVTPVVQSMSTRAYAAGSPAPGPSTTASTVPTPCPPHPPCVSSGPWTLFDFIQPGDEVGPFAIVASAASSLEVTDAFCVGDQFEVFVDGSSVGVTSEPCGTQVCGAPDETPDPDAAYANGRYSSGCFQLAPGSHMLVIQAIRSPHDGGTAFFRGVTIVGSRRAAPAPNRRRGDNG
jgi:hypothetical protein